MAYFNLGCSYNYGWGVERNMKKANHLFGIADITGHVVARHQLGKFEYQGDNYHRAYKHMIIAARAGHRDSFEAVKSGYVHVKVSKDENMKVC